MTRITKNRLNSSNVSFDSLYCHEKQILKNTSTILSNSLLKILKTFIQATIVTTIKIAQLIEYLTSRINAIQIFIVIMIAMKIENINRIRIQSMRMFLFLKKSRIRLKRTSKIENVETLNFKTRFESVETISLSKLISSITLEII